MRDHGRDERRDAEFDRVRAGALAGEPRAFEALWREYAPAVAGYLRLQGAWDPDGLTNEVFLGAFRNLRGFTGSEERFRTWLFTIAHRRLVDDRRRAGVRPVAAGTDVLDVAPVAASAEDEAIRLTSAERVRIRCAALSPDQRDVLLLRIVAELTIDEVAAALGRTPDAVKQLQRRGLAALRREFDREGVTR